MPYSDPEKHRANSRKWRANNPDKAKARCKSWIENNRKKWREGQRRSRFKSRYGISVEEYDGLCFVQDGKCAICPRKPSRLVVDHDHKTGKVRGLLCHSCNTALGLFGDNESSLVAAISYLRETK